jgi:hypothetical protein
MATGGVLRLSSRWGVRRLRTRTLRVRTSSPSENVARDHPGFSPPAPNHKPQDRFGPWGFTGEEDGDWSGSSVLQSLGSLLAQTPFVGVGVLTAQNRERRMATGVALRFSSR